MIPIKIDKQADQPLYIQIREQVIALFQEGELKPGDRLPPVSSLAKAAGVTQATIRRAMEDLSKQGYTSCHVGRGTFIKDPSQQSREKVDTCYSRPYSCREEGEAVEKREDKPLGAAASSLRVGIDRGLCDLMALAQKPGMIHFDKGIPDSGLLPENILKHMAEDAMGTSGHDLMLASDAMGFLELRQEIARRFSGRGVKITPDQVLITNGSQQAMMLIALWAARHHWNCIFESPCFKGVTDSFSLPGNRLMTVERDSQGPCVEKLVTCFPSDNCLLYLCPEFHNPTGRDLSPQRYNELVQWAKERKSIVVADEIFHDLRFEGDSLPSLMAALGGEQSIVISSLSKSFTTGLRLGWLISSRERVRVLSMYKLRMDHSSPALMQGVALSLLRSGRYDSHVEVMRREYLKRRNCLVKALDKHMPSQVSHTVPQGGFSLFVELPRGYSSVALFLLAVEKGVAFLPAPLFDVDLQHDQQYINALRLTYAHADEKQINEGVKLLAQAVKELFQRSPGDSTLGGLGNFQ